MKTVVCLKNNSEFGSNGLRSYFEYRDLGITEATDGRFVARVIRPAANRKETLAGWHAHYADFRLLYVLKGWMTFHYKEFGTIKLEAGDAIYQGHEPHTELEHSEDLEVLEVATPVDFETSAVKTA